MQGAHCLALSVSCTTLHHASKMALESAVTTVSAPGKVLLAGGYLVLESPNVGLVVAANKRFYCTVTHENEDSSLSSNGETTIRVHSPQFHATWDYECRIDDEELLLRSKASNASENGFVEKTLQVVLGYLWQQSLGLLERLPSRLDVVIRADNDFYSVLRHLKERNWDATPENVASLPKFLPCPIVDGKTVVNKTGLGSSAALVTSLVGALLQSFGAIQLPTSINSTLTNNTSDNFKSSLQIAHNLAQICHCHAQGKVGSGFDVSSAVFGSHVYQRFPKCILPDLLSSLERFPQSVTVSTAQMLNQITRDSWSGGVQAPLKVPRGLELLLADVCGGSESPSMARKVLAWKQSRTDLPAQPYWENLADINPNIVTLFDKLSSGALEKYASALSQLTAKEWNEAENSTRDYQEVAKNLLELRQAFGKARTNLKQMGDAAGVPIEPDEQTALADATMALPGVVAATVPGAGGYDALACLYIADSSDSVRNRIGVLWATLGTNSNFRVCPLAVQSAAFGEGLCEVSNFDPS